MTSAVVKLPFDATTTRINVDAASVDAPSLLDDATDAAADTPIRAHTELRENRGGVTRRAGAR